MKRSRTRSTASSGSDRGSAVVEFSLIAVLITSIFVVVLQVGVYLHQRNVIAASAQAGARYAANANVDSSAGSERAAMMIEQSLSAETADALSCTVTEEIGRAGLIEVVVRCVGAIPAIATVFGDVLPIDVTGRAVKEGQ